MQDLHPRPLASYFGAQTTNPRRSSVYANPHIGPESSPFNTGKSPIRSISYHHLFFSFRVFSGARAAASLGVSAAHAWGGVADAVKDAREAADTAMVAVTAAATTFSRDSVPKAAASGISASNDLKRRGAELLARSDGKSLVIIFDKYGMGALKSTKMTNGNICNEITAATLSF